MITVVFDFDGVIHKYRKGYQDGSIYDEPDMVAVNAIRDLMCTGYAVAIVSPRDPDQIVDWIRANDLFECDIIPMDVTSWNDCSVVGVTNRKISAMLYIDDRALRYDHTYAQDLIVDILLHLQDNR